MNGTGERPKLPSFMVSPKFMKLWEDSVAVHRGQLAVSSNDYLLRRHLELLGELRGRSVLYLDTNHWVNLRHVVLRSSNERPGYREVIEVLNSLRKAQRICCPVSFALFQELMKQSDPATRLASARLMDQMSGGVCLQSPLDLIRQEWRQHCLQTVLGRDTTPVVILPWTRAGFWNGVIIPEFGFLPNADREVHQKVWVDVKWAMGFEELVEYAGNQEYVDWFAQRFAAARNDEAAHHRAAQLPFGKQLERERAMLIQSLGDDLKEICWEVQAAASSTPDPVKVLQPFIEGRDPWVAPSLQILAGVNAAVMPSKKKFLSHDLMDFIHVAQAVPYCDAVFCDKRRSFKTPNAG